MTITQALDAIDRRIGRDVVLGYRLGNATHDERVLPAAEARAVILTVASAATDHEVPVRFTVTSVPRRAAAA